MLVKVSMVWVCVCVFCCIVVCMMLWMDGLGMNGLGMLRAWGAGKGEGRGDNNGK